MSSKVHAVHVVHVIESSFAMSFLFFAMDMVSGSPIDMSPPMVRAKCDEMCKSTVYNCANETCTSV